MKENFEKLVLFKGLPETEVANILERHAHVFKVFEKKEFIFSQNSSCERLIILVAGTVQAQMIDSTGKLLILDELKAGQLLAPAFLFSDQNKFPVSALVVEDAKVLYFSREVALKMMQENVKILQNFLKIISNRSHFLSQKVKLHALMPLKGKISNYLLLETEKQNSLHISITHTQQELADRFGVARPSLARALNEMEKEGVLEGHNRQFFIKNLALLKRWAK